ncbi:short-chain dehydrogenase/reductase SDR [Psychromonas ingrahamii 37]|uniref:Short-chain dehydrogenase/reductase SDR n=1 Tax=Psychromonas ingrahamii (strain DSM 17664 / CCUG 51855 / 37) TaxID=357804 RepID=A1STH7_PSYIN|nr:SDR family oxidoreductase [Psychromonas ingrahamii]ABM02792.1 short-chain dehydrogenase/reductase SDR [Psychromonas ingrahamii 37]
MKLKDKRVLLTGATGGIGRALSLALVEAGCHLILVGREQAKLDQLIDDLPHSSNYLSIAADIGCAEGIKAVDKECQLYIQEGIPIDIVINNAGCNTFDYLTQRTLTSIEQEIAVNISAPMQLTKLSLTWLSYPGIILNIGSTFAAIGYPGYATYCATKAALHRFSEAMQRELKDTGRQVLFVAPRATDTDLNDQRVTALNKKLGNSTDSPKAVAKQILKTLQTEQKVCWIGWPEKLFVRINQLFPSLVASSIHKQKKHLNKSLSDINE